jgi:hypothetical protein
VVFHPSARSFFSFVILIEAKLIHHYVNGYSSRIDPYSECPLTCILLFYFNCIFECKSLKLGLLVIKESIKFHILQIVLHF